MTLDDDVFAPAKAQAEASGKKLGEVLSQLARRGLRASGAGANQRGLPVFKVPACKTDARQPGVPNGDNVSA